MQFRKPFDLAEGFAKYFGAETRAAHSQKQRMREARGLNFFGELHKTGSCFLLLADNAQPAKPLVFIVASPQRRIARPQLANFSARGPFFESRTGGVFQLAWQRKALGIDSGSHNPSALH